MKIIPAIDLLNGQVVRLYKGDPKQKTVYSDDPMSIAKKWQKAERWQVGLWDNKFALCGLRMLWVVIGTKWVYMSAPVCQTRMKITRKEWNALTDKERYHTDEDIQIYREKRNKIWDL